MRNRNAKIETRKSRRGMTAILAMLYLALIASLAVGFYASSNSAVMVSENEKRGGQALAACESGMDFMNYQLAQVALPYGVTQAQLFTNLYNQLKTQIENTGNMGSKTISGDSNYIYIPAGTNNWISNGSGGEFRVVIENGHGEMGTKVAVKVTGRQANYLANRAVRMEFDLAKNASDIFNFGVATKGSIQTEGSSRIRGLTDPTKGSILSTSSSGTPVIVNGKEVSGDISVSNPSAVITVGASTSVGGTNNMADIMANHVHKGVAPPEFPTIDTNAFKAYATNVYSGGTTLTNVRIPPNTNPTFGGGMTIKGVLYIETPNKVTFNGNVDIQGVIVTQNNPLGNLSTNMLTFKGNSTVTGVETLPDTFGDLKKLTGAFILAPGFSTTFTGSFGTVNGAIITDKVTMSGNAGGTIKGSIVSLTDNPLTLNGSSEIVIASTGTTDYPAGVFFSSHYSALPGTYEEVKP